MAEASLVRRVSRTLELDGGSVHVQLLLLGKQARGSHVQCARCLISRSSADFRVAGRRLALSRKSRRRHTHALRQPAVYLSPPGLWPRRELRATPWCASFLASQQPYRVAQAVRCSPVHSTEDGALCRCVLQRFGRPAGANHHLSRKITTYVSRLRRPQWKENCCSC
jgi:hypothetical protein